MIFLGTTNRFTVTSETKTNWEKKYEFCSIFLCPTNKSYQAVGLRFLLMNQLRMCRCTIVDGLIYDEVIHFYQKEIKNAQTNILE